MCPQAGICCCLSTVLFFWSVGEGEPVVHSIFLRSLGLVVWMQARRCGDLNSAAVKCVYADTSVCRWVCVLTTHAQGLVLRQNCQRGWTCYQFALFGLLPSLRENLPWSLKTSTKITALLPCGFQCNLSGGEMPHPGSMI